MNRDGYTGAGGKERLPAVTTDEVRSVVLPRLQVPLKVVAESAFRLDTIISVTALSISAIMIWAGVFALTFFQDPNAPLCCFTWNYAIMAAYAWGLGGYLNHGYGGKLEYVGNGKYEPKRGTEKPYDGGLISARFVICIIYCVTSVAFAWAAFETPSWNDNYGCVLADLCFAGAGSATVFALCYGFYASLSRADVIATKSIKRAISGRFAIGWMGFLMNVIFAYGLWRIVSDLNETAIFTCLPCLILSIVGCLGVFAVFVSAVDSERDRGLKPGATPR